MRVDGVRIGWIDWRQESGYAQPHDSTPPLLIPKANQPVGQATDRGLGAQRLEAVAARRAVKQADATEDREQNRLTCEPFLLVGFHHAPRLIVAPIVRMRAGGCDRADARRRSAFP